MDSTPTDTGQHLGLFAYVALTTNLGAAAGAVAAMAIAWSVTGKADIPTMLNGVIAALVAITASCAFVEPWAAVVIGSVSGILTYFTAIWFDRKGIDDPVYAFSVHGVAGIWGTLSTGFFATPELVEQAGVGAPGLFYGGGWHQLGVQALGLVGSLLYVFIVSYVILAALKATIGLRVTEEEEVIGLDLSEHGDTDIPSCFPQNISPPSNETALILSPDDVHRISEASTFRELALLCGELLETSRLEGIRRAAELAPFAVLVNLIHERLIRQGVLLAVRQLAKMGVGTPPVPFAYLQFGSGGLR